MIRSRFLVSFPLLFFALTIGYSAPKNHEASSFVERLLSQMTEEEILAQLFLVGYSNAEPTPLLMEWIRSRGIGGVKIFGWNAEDVSVLKKSIQIMNDQAQKSRMKIPLFIATDQEGGWVRHVKGDTSITPGNLALGAARYPHDAYQTGYLIGKELMELGINMNFAPTVDVYVNPEANVIGPRAFSSDPRLTGILGVAYYRGMQEAGVVCAAKHYPGHGNADEDSHGVLPVIFDTYETLWKRDLLPYRMLISEGIPAILSGHLSFPRISPDNRPTSLSPFFGIELLRNRLGFQGILITDDLYMSGANRGKSMVDVCVEAIQAGNDLLMLSKTPQLDDPIWRTALSLFRRDPVFKHRVLESARRVLLTKIKHITGGWTEPAFPPSQSRGKARALDQEPKEFFLEQAARSVTILRNQRSILPYQPGQEEKVLLAGPFKEFIRLGKGYFPQAEEFLFSYSPFYRAVPEEKRGFQRASAKADTIIFCLANPNGMELLQTLKNHPGKVIVFSVLTPVYLRDAPWVHTTIAVYGWGTDSYKAGFSVLTGAFPALGKNPIEALLPERSP